MAENDRDELPAPAADKTQKPPSPSSQETAWQRFCKLGSARIVATIATAVLVGPLLFLLFAWVGVLFLPAILLVPFLFFSRKSPGHLEERPHHP